MSNYLKEVVNKAFKKKIVQEVKDTLQVLKYIKSLKGDYRGFAQHTNSKDIHSISSCCFNLLEDNIPLTHTKKRQKKIFLKPIKKGDKYNW